MDLAHLIIEALKFIFPAYCANAVPVITGGGLPIDLDKKFFDGKPIFG
ncbi:MAG: CDP-archaeol synthase, partial [Candidatus Bathyarchaeia archaeon]